MTFVMIIRFSELTYLKPLLIVFLILLMVLAIMELTDLVARLSHRQLYFSLLSFLAFVAVYLGLMNSYSVYTFDCIAGRRVHRNQQILDVSLAHQKLFVYQLKVENPEVREVDIQSIHCMENSHIKEDTYSFIGKARVNHRSTYYFTFTLARDKASSSESSSEISLSESPENLFYPFTEQEEQSLPQFSLRDLASQDAKKQLQSVKVHYVKNRDLFAIHHIYYRHDIDD